MGNRISKVYTKTGDDGTTGLADGTRVSKNNLIIVLLGELDELNANLGLTISTISDQDDCIFNTNLRKIKYVLYDIQHLVFDIGGDISVPTRNSITEEHITYLEKWIDYFNDTIPPLKEFVLPGGNMMASHCHLARTVCRRAELTLVSYQSHRQTPNTIILKFMNRLSDLLFVIARTLARMDGQEVLWNQNQELTYPK